MEKLIDLLNQYEESMIDKDLEEEEDGIIEYGKVWKEYNGHLRFNNANTVQFPDEMFDYYAISKKYGFIEWLCNNHSDMINREDDYLGRLFHHYFDYSIKEWEIDHRKANGLTMILNASKNPISDLISYLK